MTPSHNFVRESNAELLRIICMLMIVFHHFVVHALYADVFEGCAEPQTLDEKLLMFWHSLFYIGVNCFILISGWFTIKTKLTGFVKLYLCLSFYKSLTVCRLLFFSGGEYTVVQHIIYILHYAFMPFSTGKDLWFIDCYLLLMLIAPVLNLVIHLPKKKILYMVTMLLSIYNIYTGLMGKSWVNADGFCATQFIWMYFLGASLRSYMDNGKTHPHRLALLMTYLLSSICWGLITFYCLSKTGSISAKYWQPFHYNNIFVLVNAVTFFLFVMSFHFKSRLVNSVAASVLAVYVIQECGVIEYAWFVKPSVSSWVNIGYLFALSIAFFTVAVLVDKVRLGMLSPVYKRIYELSDRFRGRVFPVGQ